ncbi:DUF3100 domain-containing protein [Brevibacillus sp. SYSU BS000544]|uniref:DUF3100 domain-containing protein n=1 Tax=Brevibacillus sp. SYSU BS000544 TaxID=3416443 RepID=UPI003CE5350C
MEALKNWKLHLFALIIVVISELIGIRHIGIMVLMPILYATILGGVISWPKLKILNMKDMEHASAIFPVALMILLAKVGLGVGPQLDAIMAAKGTLFIQMFAHFLGIVILGLPVAMLLGLGRESIGATYSLGREAQVAIIADKFGLNTPEGHGVMGVFIVGTVLGALWTSVFVSVIAALDIFHPYALALGGGNSSMSMSTAALEVITQNYPDADIDKVQAYMNTSNLITNVMAIYVNMFLTLPLTVWLYNFFDKFRKGNKPQVNAAA